MARSLSLPKSKRPTQRPTKRAPRKAPAERRQASRGNLKLLTAFRCLDAGQESFTGFVRALNLSSVGALLESPDEFAPGQKLAVEFLLDNNRIAQADVRVARVTKRENFYHVAVEFTRVSAQARRLIDQQISS
ncbi:MAG: PilZ domain-containing protein [Anaerolineales bacterium]|nr:PilZ domain-containing protein [Anaerolineales bacterium]